MVSKLKNYSFSLPEDLVKKIKEYTEKRYIPSASAAVREALEIYLKKIEKENLSKQMEKAAKDPMFMEDINKTMGDFQVADEEIIRHGEEW